MTSSGIEMFTWLPDHISQAMFRFGHKSESLVLPYVYLFSRYVVFVS